MTKDVRTKLTEDQKSQILEDLVLIEFGWAGKIQGEIYQQARERLHKISRRILLERELHNLNLKENND